MESLEAVAQHGAVGLMQDRRRDVNHQVGVDADEMAVECRVVELAECEAVRNDRLAARVPVRQDMCGFQQLLVPEVADRTALTIGGEDPLTEALLMQSLARVAGHVLPASLCLHRLLDARPEVQQSHIINGNLESERSGIIADDVDGPDWEIAARHQAIQVDERDLTLHREPKSDVLRVARVGAVVIVSGSSAAAGLKMP